MTSYSEQDFHDAIIKSVHIDFSTARASISFESFADENSNDRTQQKLEFSGVESFNIVSNVFDVADNIGSGNVNHMSLKSPGKSYLYLINGLIEIAADSGAIVDQ